MPKKVLVAMSGGVDSSAACALLLEQGYDVSGATMKLWEKGAYFQNGGEDCVSNAVVVARELGIKHYVFDFSNEFFKNVVTPFCGDYKNGMTPNPCVYCNKYIKFGAFYKRAMELGFDYIATGHYACVERQGDIFYLKSENAAKDQTYVLYNLNQEILSHLLLPVGGIEKQKIRIYAKKAGISAAESPDSQEICFIPDNDYAAFLMRQGIECAPGDFTDKSGTVMGVHNGIINYTVGQRKGLGAFGSPKYVLKIDREQNRVVLGENEDLFVNSLTCDHINIISGEMPKEIRAGVKIRYNSHPADATVRFFENQAQVIFDAPVRAVTPGQSAVFYDGCRLLGGGRIIF